MLRKLNRAIVITGVVCVFAIWGTPARSQEAEVSTPPPEKVQPAIEANPKEAITTKDPGIPVEDLQLLVKPLTLKEIQNEAIAWQLLLQNKSKEISNAEIVIKRENRSIAKQKEAATALDEAKKSLEENEKIQKNSPPDSPAYKEATKKLEEAREKIKKAQEVIKEATNTKNELKDDISMRSALKEAEKTGELDRAKQTLDEAKKEREKLVGGTPTYDVATQKIEELDRAIKAFEEAQEAKKTAPADSPEYNDATQKVEAATEQLKKAREAIKKSATNGGSATEQSAKQLNEAADALENTTIKTDGETKIEGSPDAVGSQGNGNKQGQQLEKTSDKLQENAEAESALKNQLVVNVTDLNAAQTALVDRFNVVLEELRRKGGDPKPYQNYIQAISRVEVDVKDAEGLGVRLISWLKADEGGLRWAGNIGKFIGIVAVSAIVSQILGMILDKILSLLGTGTFLHQFTVILVKRGGILIGVLLALTALEVSLGPIVALVGGASFVLAFALQSNLGNFASGLMLMVYKPFDIKDEVELAGIYGIVDSITLASTKLKTFGAEMVTIPNNTVWSDKIVNYTHAKNRQIKIEIRSKYSNNISHVQKILIEVATSHPLVLKDPAPTSWLKDFGEYYLLISLSAWTKTSDFWKTRGQMLSTIYERFEKEGIFIATPTHDIRVLSGSGAEKKLSLLTEESSQEVYSQKEIPLTEEFSQEIYSQKEIPQQVT